jgi:hypothetical protein
MSRGRLRASPSAESKREVPAGRRWLTLPGVAVCVVLALVLYAPCVTPAFEFDDTIVISKVVARTPAWWRLLGHTYAQGNGGGTWRPLFDIAMWIQWHVFGTFAPAYHLVSAAMHGLAGAAAGALAFTLCDGSAWAGAFAAGLLLVQPFPEGIAWITGSLLNVLSAVLYLTGLYAFVRFRQSVRHAWALAALALVAYCLSLGVYEAALVAPLTIVAYDAVYLWGRWTWPERLWRSGGACATAGIVGALFLTLRRFMIGHWVGAYGPAAVVGYHRWLPRLGTVARALAEPVNAAMTHAPWTIPLLVLYWVGVAASAALAFRNASDGRPVLFGLALAVISLIPYSGFIEIPRDLESTRYLYLTAVGIIVAIAAALRPARVCWPVAACVFASVCVGSAGLLFLNQQPWATAGAMVSGVMDAASRGPIQVYGVPRRAFHGAYTFGFDENIRVYPGGHGRNATLDGTFVRGPHPLYWDTRRLRPIPAVPLAAWSGIALTRWTWGPQAEVTVFGISHCLGSGQESSCWRCASWTVRVGGVR